MKTPRSLILLLWLVGCGMGLLCRPAAAIVAPKLTPVGTLPASSNLNLSISLPLRNQAELNKFLQQLYDKTSPNYRHFLTPAQFTELYGPTAKDYQAVVNFAQSAGFKVTHTYSNRMLVNVSATAAQIQTAFQVTMQVYQHPTANRLFYAPNANPVMPVGVPILTVNGLDNYTLPFPKLVRKPTSKVTANVAHATGSGPNGAYLGYDFRDAYVPTTALDGTGQSVALFELDGYYAVDISNYVAAAGLPGVPLVNVPVLGGVTPGVNGGIDEVSLDIEMVISMAPNLANVYVYEGTDPDSVLNQIVTDNFAQQISSSWGWSPGPDLTADGIFQEMAAQGQTFFNAVGDSAAFSPGTADNYAPTTSTNITQVGGTTLTTSGPHGSYVSEVVWLWYPGGGSSGGVSSYYPIPSYQQGISMLLNGGSTTMRNVPDVALTADNVYVIANQGADNGTFGGTSCAAPLWAAFTALINQQAASLGQPAVGFLNPAVYTIGKGPTYSTSFHDTTVGNNDNGAGTSFNAVTGYDLCTGWGTPMESLIQTLAIGNPLSVVSAIVSGGNGNGIIDPNECNSLTIIVTNLTSSDVIGPIEGTLSSTTPGIVITQPTAVFPTVPANGTATNNVPLFTVSSVPGFACGTTIDFTLTMKVAGLGFITAPFSLPTTSSILGTQQRFDDNTPLSIPDVSTVDSTNIVAGIPGPAGTVTVSLWIEHTFDSDLQFALTAPDGLTTVLLADQLGGGGHNYGLSCADTNRTTFDDNATNSIINGTAPFVGTYQPMQLLGTFSGVAANGPWVLRISDLQAGDVGTLHCWSLFITPTVCTNGPGTCYPMPGFCPDPASIDFGTVQVGASSPSKRITITNCGNSGLVISNAVVIGAESNDFAIMSETCTTVIPTNSTCTIDLLFSPSAAGTRSAVLQINDNAGGPHLIPLTGTGVQCSALNLTPQTLPQANIAAPYSQTLSVSGGTTPYLFMRDNGVYPPGITMTTNGVISGVPTAFGTFDFHVQVFDAAGCAGERWYRVVVGCGGINLVPVSFAQAQINVPFSQQMAASGTLAPYTFALTSGSLPAGLTLTSNGLLAGVPTSGSSAFTITTTDANGCTTNRNYILTVANPPPTVLCPTITIMPATLVPGPVFGVPYNRFITASGGTAPYTFSLAGGTLPPGLTVTSGGALTGTPTGAGSFSFLIAATDSNNCVGAQTYTVNIPCPTISLTPTTLSNGNLGIAYSQTLLATGGAAPYTFAVTAGSLPTGLTLTSAGLLSGTPTVPGPFAFTITVQDNSGCTVSQGYSLSISACIGAPITIAPLTLPDSTVGSVYTQTITAAAGTAPYTFSITSGTLPGGLTLNTNGFLAGTLTNAGTFNFTVTAVDSNKCFDNQSYTINVACSAVTLTALLPDGIIGTAYSQTVAALGPNTPYAFSVIAGALPTGLSLTSTGLVSGTPTALGLFSFTIAAIDQFGCTNSQGYNVNIGCPTITLAPTALPGGAIGQGYYQIVSASGGAAPYAFTVTSGALPTGVTLYSNGAVYGTPTAAGSYTFTITATDANGCTGTQSYTIGISTTPCPAVTITPLTLPVGTQSAVYNQTLAANGGQGPYTFSVLAGGNLPAGVNLFSNGQLTGTPAAPGTYNFTVQVQDANGCTGARAYSLVIGCATITINPALPNGSIGAAYSQTLTASGGTAPYTFAVTTGTLPTSLTLTSAGVLAGTPTVGGGFAFTVTATDKNGCTGTRSYTVNINCPAIGIGPALLPAGGVGLAYNQQLTATNGAAPYTYSVGSGTLPAGMTLSATGLLSGTPVVGGTFTFTVVARDANTCLGPQTYTLFIPCPVITFAPTPAALSTATVGQVYSSLLTATNGTAPYTFSLLAPTLPPGITLFANGQLSGLTTVGGSFPFTAIVKDANGCTGFQNYTLLVNCPAISITPSLSTGTVAVAFGPAVFAATGGSAPYTFAKTTGTLPTGLTFTAGVLAGTPTAPGSYPFSIQATDANGCTATRSYTVVIGCATITLNASLANGSLSNPYSQTNTASGGLAPYTFTTSGPLPTGLSLANNGVLSGTPTALGVFTFTVVAQDAAGCTGLQKYTITIGSAPCPTITILPGVLSTATVGVAYSQILTATGGLTGYTFSLVGGTLPAGVNLFTGGGTGQLAGTPNTVGAYSFTVQARDGNNCIGTNTYQLVVACPTLTVTPAVLATGTVGTVYSQPLTGVGGTGPYTFAPVGGLLPPGVTLSAAGLFSGTPTASGSYNFTVNITDQHNCSSLLPLTLTMVCPAITLTAPPLAAASLGVPYSQGLTATNGTAPYTFAVTSNALPPGLTLSSAGLLSGTPTSGGGFSFMITVTDAHNCSGGQLYTLNVSCPTISINPAILATGTVGAAYSQAVSATNGATPYTYTILGGTLPAGLNLTSDGMLTGTPLAGGSYDVTVGAFDVNNCLGSQEFTLVVQCPTITLMPSLLATGTVGAAYGAQLSATNGFGADTFTFALVSGVLPSGVNLFVDGTVTGTPTSAGAFTFTVSARDANDCTTSTNYTLVVQCQTIGILPATLPDANQGTPYSQTLTATNAVGATQFYFTGGQLPTSLNLSDTGVLSGTPSQTGTFVFAVTVLDANGCNVTQTYTNNVLAPLSPFVAEAPSVTQLTRKTFGATTLSVSGGVTLLNNSAKNSSATARVKFYLSPTTTVGVTAKLLSNQIVGIVAAHKTRRLTFAATMSGASVGTAAGQYVVAVIDGSNTVVLGKLH